MAMILEGLQTLFATLTDVLPIVLFIFGFQALVIRKPLPNLPAIAAGLVLTVLGLGLFLIGLEQALFPLGRLMAEQLTAPSFLGVDLNSGPPVWSDYLWVYVFAVTIGFATTIAEPSLLAVSMKANDVSGGAISVWGLRVAVAIGVAFGVGLGCYRIVTGLPLPYFIMAGYVVVIIQTFWAPKLIIPIAYDSGGVTTSTVTVPLIAALGLGLAETIRCWTDLASSPLPACFQSSAYSRTRNSRYSSTAFATDGRSSTMIQPGSPGRAAHEIQTTGRLRGRQQNRESAGGGARFWRYRMHDHQPCPR